MRIRGAGIGIRGMRGVVTGHDGVDATAGTLNTLVSRELWAIHGLWGYKGMLCFRICTS